MTTHMGVPPLGAAEPTTLAWYSVFQMIAGIGSRWMKLMGGEGQMRRVSTHDLPPEETGEQVDESAWFCGHRGSLGLAALQPAQSFWYVGRVASVVVEDHRYSS